MKVNDTLKRINQTRKTNSIIKRFSIIKEYNVLSYQAFRKIVEQMIQKNSSGIVIMSDINDLYQTNKNRGKKSTNLLIKSIVSKIKSSVSQNDIKKYLIGKLGDELYLYIPDKKISDLNNLVSDLKKISAKELSLSVGTSDKLDKGIDFALNEAEDDMSKYKQKYKIDKMKKVFGNSIDSIVDFVIKTQIEKMRINLNSLKENHLNKLSNTFEKAILDIDVDTLISDNLDQSEGQNLSKSNQDFSSKQNKEYEDKYIKEAYLIYGPKASKKQINNYVLGQIISRYPTDGAQNFTYFEGQGYKEVLKNIKKSKKIDNVDMLVMGASGLKKINDLYGHDVGDAAINNLIKDLNSTIKDSNIKTFSDIIVRGGGNSFIFLDKLTSEQKNSLNQNLKNRQQAKPNTQKLSAFLTSINIPTKNITSRLFITAVNSNLNKAENILDKKGHNQKIQSVDNMKFAIEKMYQQLLDFEDIRLLCSIGNEPRKQILDKINSDFKQIIQNQKQEFVAKQSQSKLENLQYTNIQKKKENDKER